MDCFSIFLCKSILKEHKSFKINVILLYVGAIYLFEARGLCEDRPAGEILRLWSPYLARIEGILPNFYR